MNPKLKILAAVIVVLVIIGGVWFYTSQPKAPMQVETSTPTPTETPTITPTIEPTPQINETERIIEVCDNYYILIREGDIDKLVSLFTEDIAFYQTDTFEAHGKDELRDVFTQTIESKYKIYGELNEVNIVDSEAVSNYSVTITYPEEDYFIDIFHLELSDGEWKINEIEVLSATKPSTVD